VKRALLFGTTFLIAAVLGFGIVVSLAGNSQAAECNPDQLIYQYECNYPGCQWPTPHGRFLCGYDSQNQTVCECEFMDCVRFCPW